MYSALKPCSVARKEGKREEKKRKERRRLTIVINRATDSNK